MIVTNRRLLGFLVELGVTPDQELQKGFWDEGQEGLRDWKQNQITAKRLDTAFDQGAGDIRFQVPIE